MKVISVVNQKGGVGKSTIACNLAVNAVLDGKKTLLVDADPQGTSLAFRALREANDLKSVAITTPTIHKDINDFSNFDVVIVDAGGRDNTLFRSAITAASKGILLVPVLPSDVDIWAAEDTFKILEEARVFVDISAYVVFNQAIQNTNISKDAKDAIEELNKESNIELLNSVLISRIDYKRSIGQGLGVVEYAPKSKAAIETLNLYNEIKEILAL